MIEDMKMKAVNDRNTEHIRCRADELKKISRSSGELMEQASKHNQRHTSDLTCKSFSPDLFTSMPTNR